MIWPPFTVLILKNTRQPVTIRITAVAFAALLTVIPVLSFAAGAGITAFMFRIMSEDRVPFVDASGSPAAPAAETGEAGARMEGASGPGIENVFISRPAKNTLEISFVPANISPAEVCYIWVVLNPDSESGEPFIYPRNPVFRGAPVDYRNGIPFSSVRERKCTVSVDDIPGSLPLERVRILVYSSGGEILADQRFEIGQNAKV